MDEVRDLDCAHVEEHDLVSSYLGGRLPEDEAEAFEKHYFGCERCWAEVRAGQEIRAAFAAPISRGKVLPGRWRKWLPLSIAAAVGIAALVGVLLIRRSGGSGIEELAAASGTRRVTETRLTGPFAYGTVEPVLRGPEDQPTAPLKLRRVALEALEKAQNDPSALNLHAAGVAHLLLDEWDDAVDALVKASELDPADAQIWSDLSAAYQTRALRRDRTADIPRAFEAAKRAADLDPSLDAAQFNLALALEALGQREQALKAWTSYLRLDSTSGWASEAITRARALKTPPESNLWHRMRERLLGRPGESSDSPALDSMARRFPQQSRQYLEDELLTSWASQPQEHGNNSKLAEAGSIARALFHANGEGLALDSVRIIQEARIAGTFQLQQLRNGHVHFGLARRHYRAADIDAAFDQFRTAESYFRGTRSPFVYLARLGQASCQLYGLKTTDAESSIADLVAVGQDNPPYRALHGQSLWLKGMIEGLSGHPYESLRSYEQSLTVFRLLGEKENIAGLHGLMAPTYELLGLQDQAWAHRLHELRLLERGASTARITNALGELVRESLRQGYPRLASLAGSEEARISDLAAIPLFRSYSSLWRAQISDELGHYASATKELERARAECGRITDPGSRDRTQSEIDLASVRIEARLDTGKALEAANRAIRFARDIDDRSRLPELHLLRGRLYRRRHQSGLATRDFVAGIKEVEDTRAEIVPEGLRASYFESARALFDEAITLMTAKSETVESFRLADQAHARVLLDSMTFKPDPSGSTGAGSNSVDMSALQALLGTRHALLEFWVSRSLSIAWIVRRDRITMCTIGHGRAELDREVEASLKALLAGVASPALERLYDILIRPIERYLSDVSSLVLVPDGPLHELPMGALRDKNRAQHLAERFAISIAPSSSFMVARSGVIYGTDRPEKVLVVANPSFDQATFPKLSRLKGAEAEADAIARAFPGTTILRGPNATKTAFLRLAPHADIIDFAGHAVAASKDQRFSALVLAPEPATIDRGLLYAHEISQLKLRPSSIVILAACRSASGLSATDNGATALAYAFLRAGSRAVLADLLPVSDFRAATWTPALLELLHWRDPSSALRAALVAPLPHQGLTSQSIRLASFQAYGWEPTSR